MKKKRFLAGLLAAAMCLGGMPAFSAHAAESAQDSSSVVAEVDSHYSVIIPKSLQMAVDTATWHGTAGYQASVVGDIEPGKSVYVVPQARFDMVQADGGAIVDTSVSQTKTEWPSADVKAEEADAIWGDGSLSGDGFQPGDWSGVFYFNIAADDSGLNVEAPGDKIVEADLSNGDVAEAGTFQLGQGQSGSIQLVHDGVDVTRKALYESDNERITVDENGKVGTENAVGGDEATITATYFLPTASAAEGGSANAVKAYFKVQVIGIAFDKETVTVRPGDSVTVTAEVLPGSVDGTVKWMLNGLDFGAEGNTITINVAEDAQPGNYTLVAMYGGASQTLNIKVAAGPSASGIVDGGRYEGPVEVTVGDGCTVTVDGNALEVVDGKFTVAGDGAHVIVVSGEGGDSVTYNITIVHKHSYVDGFCSCGKEDPAMFSDPGLYTASGKKLASWFELTEDYGMDVSSDMTSSDNVGTLCESSSVNPNGTNYVLVLSPDATAIGSNAFNGSTKLRRVAGLEQVTSIGANAFSGCTSLTGVSLGDSLLSIGDHSFNGSGILAVDLPDSVTTIGNGAFNGCTGLKGIVIPPSVTTIGSSAFSGCTGITEVAVPSSVTSLGGSAFSGCSSLSSISLPDTLDRISDGLLKNTKISAVSIPSACTVIGSSAFSGCRSLIQIDIPGNVTTIKSGAFAGCTSLTDVTMTDSVTTLGTGSSASTGVFSGCAKLKNVTLSNNITEIPAYAFSNIGSYSNKMTLNIPSKLKAVGTYAFYNAYIANDLSFPSTLTSIGKSAFENAWTGEIISLGSVTAIPDNCFKGGSKSFAKTAIPDTCRSLGESCFTNSGSVYGLFIPASVTTVRDIFKDENYRPYGTFYPATIKCEAESKPSGWSSTWYRITSYRNMAVGGGSSMVYYDHEAEWGCTR